MTPAKITRSGDAMIPRMATQDETVQALLDRIALLASKTVNADNSTVVLQLAEAYAWLQQPAQSHGSSSKR